MDIEERGGGANFPGFNSFGGGAAAGGFPPDDSNNDDNQDEEEEEEEEEGIVTYRQTVHNIRSNLLSHLDELTKEIDNANQAAEKSAGELNPALFKAGGAFADATRNAERTALVFSQDQAISRMEEQYNAVVSRLKSEIANLKRQERVLKGNAAAERGTLRAVPWLERRLQEAKVALELHESQASELAHTKAQLKIAQNKLEKAGIAAEGAADMTRSVTQLQTENTSLETRLKHLQTEIDRYKKAERELADKQRELGTVRAELATASQRIDALRAELDATTNRLAERDRGGAASAPADAEPSNDSAPLAGGRELALENGILRGTVERLRAELAAARSLESESTRLRSELGAYKAREAAATNVDEVAEQIQSLSLSNGGMRAELAALHAQSEKREANTERVLSDLNERLELLDELARVKGELESMEKVSSMREQFSRDKLLSVERIRKRNLELQEEYSVLQRQGIADRVAWTEQATALSMEIDTLSKWRTLAARIPKALISHSDALSKHVQTAMITIEKRLSERIQMALVTATNKTVELSRQAHRDMIKSSQRLTGTAGAHPSSQPRSYEWERHGFGSIIPPSTIRDLVKEIASSINDSRDIKFIECDDRSVADHSFKDKVMNAIDTGGLICLHLCPRHDSELENVVMEHEIAHFQFKGDNRGYSCLVANYPSLI